MYDVQNSPRPLARCLVTIDSIDRRVGWPMEVVSTKTIRRPYHRGMYCPWDQSRKTLKPEGSISIHVMASALVMSNGNNSVTLTMASVEIGKKVRKPLERFNARVITSEAVQKVHVRTVYLGSSYDHWFGDSLGLRLNTPPDRVRLVHI